MRIRIKINSLIPKEAANKMAVKDKEEDKAMNKDYPGRITRAKLLMIKKKTRIQKVLMRTSIVAK